MKVKTSKGFTLAELLIVMAIIVVLAAVAIPTFGRQLETAREASDIELIRNAYSEALALAIIDAADGTINGKKGNTDLCDNTNGTDIRFKTGYTVALSGGTTQSVKTFDYVDASIAGVKVGASSPPALNALYDGYVTFTFSFDAAGSLKLDSVATCAAWPS